jgi:signal transduction histidine kinase
MSQFRFRSIRARLTAITLLAFGIVVAFLAVVSVIVSRQAMQASIDADLRRRGEDFTREVAERGNSGPFTRRSGPADAAPPPDEGGPPNGSPPMGDRPPDGPPGGPPNDSPQIGGTGQRNSSGSDSNWIAPAAIPVDPAEQAAGPYSKPYDPEGFARAAKGEDLFRTVEVDGEPRRVFSVPVRRKGKITDVVQMSYAMRPALEEIDGLRWKLLFTVVPLGLFLGGIASLLVVARLLLPLRRLNEDAVRIGREGFAQRLKPLGDDEFASLAHTLNGMVGNLEAVYRQEHASNERLQASIEQQRRFTGDASHELKTPLAIFKAHLGVLKRSRGTVVEESATVSAMEKAADRMNSLVTDLLVLARSDSGIVGERATFRLDEILRDAVQAFPASESRIELKPAMPLSMNGSPGELFRVCSNLIENALKHSGTETRVVVALERRGPEAVLSVTDHGVGIHPEHLPHLFERFYRVDRSRTSATGGTGLGLAICEQIVKNHGGTIQVESEVGKGTRFVVRLTP